jgi:hypothetical protein
VLLGFLPQHLAIDPDHCGSCATVCIRKQHGGPHLRRRRLQRDLRGRVLEL